jgi:limonene-1,2-epoxide hydrolase
MPTTPQELFERYTWTGLTRNADARADMFTPDGVLEAPFAPAGRPIPQRAEGREEIRAVLSALYREPPAADQKVNAAESRYVLHETADPGVFIAEIDAVLETAGVAETVSIVQIFRIRDGQIAMIRDYFAPEHAG